MSEINIKTEILDIKEPEPGTSQQSSDTESLNSFSDTDDENEESEEAVKPRKKRRKLYTKLNPNLKGLMGEANLRFARGDFEASKRMCFEIMRQVPDAHEPYILLAQIFENVDQTKYEGYLAIAGCLCSNDPEIWVRLAELSVQKNKIKEAIKYYGKAIKCDPKNISFHLKRLELVEKTANKKLTLFCKTYMTKHLPRNQASNIIDMCKEIAKEYHEEKNFPKALETLEIPFKRFPKKISHDLVNMMLELLLENQRYAQCLDVFIQYCNFTFEITLDEDKNISIISYQMPQNLPIDLKVKYICCLIKLKSLKLISPLINEIIINENVDEVGDLYLDMAEDLLSANYYDEALKLLIPLVKSSNYNLAAVWLKYADCLYHCNLLEQAVEAYFTVMHQAPQHVEILYPLAMSLLKLNKKSEALEVLSQDFSNNTMDVAVLIERMKLLKQINDLDEYWNCVELLFSRHCFIIKYTEEIRVLFTGQNLKEKARRIKRMRNFHADTTPIERTFNCLREPTKETEYQLFKDILKFALESGHYSQLQRFAIMALSSKRFQPFFKELFVYAFIACVYNNDVFHGYSIIKDLVTRQPYCNLAWNLFNLLLQKADEGRHYKFIIRFQERFLNVDCLQEMEANYGLAAGNYNLAMKHYMREFKKYRSPYLSLMLGLTILEFYQRPYVTDKQKLAETISHLFLYYSTNRSKDAEHEAFYNLGRMYQQIGVMHLAEHYYLKVLDSPESEIVENYPDILSLKYESAYNLHLIYKNSGNYTAARNILIKHLVI